MPGSYAAVYCSCGVVCTVRERQVSYLLPTLVCIFGNNAITISLCYVPHTTSDFFCVVQRILEYVVSLAALTGANKIDVLTGADATEATVRAANLNKYISCSALVALSISTCR